MTQLQQCRQHSGTKHASRSKQALWALLLLLLITFIHQNEKTGNKEKKTNLTKCIIIIIKRKGTVIKIVMYADNPRTWKTSAGCTPIDGPASAVWQ